jgi:hypothetical protein
MGILVYRQMVQKLDPKLANMKIQARAEVYAKLERLLHNIWLTGVQ